MEGKRVGVGVGEICSKMGSRMALFLALVLDLLEARIILLMGSSSEMVLRISKAFLVEGLVGFEGWGFSYA